MKLRGGPSGSNKVGIDMTPMIDVVFQLMIFFMLTLKITSEEGDFSINMPGIAPGPNVEEPTPVIKVRMIAGETGELGQLQLGRRNLGNDDNAYAALNLEILNIIGRPGNPLTKDTEVEIDADYELNYQEVVKAITACTGRVDPASKQVVRYIEKIKFASARKPKGA